MPRSADPFRPSYVPFYPMTELAEKGENVDVRLTGTLKELYGVRNRFYYFGTALKTAIIKEGKTMAGDELERVKRMLAGHRRLSVRLEDQGDGMGVLVFTSAISSAGERLIELTLQGRKNEPQADAHLMGTVLPPTTEPFDQDKDNAFYKTLLSKDEG